MFSAMFTCIEGFPGIREIKASSCAKSLAGTAIYFEIRSAKKESKSL